MAKKRSEDEKRDQQFNLRISKKEREMLENWAKTRNLTPSAAIREMILDRSLFIQGTSMPRNPRHYRHF